MRTDNIRKLRIDWAEDRYIMTTDCLIILVLALVWVFVFSRFVPFNMDEFYQYNPIASKFYPLNSLNTFREAAGRYDLAPFGSFYLPLRSFRYTGVLNAILYYPLFLVWRDPYSARFFSVLMIVAQSLLIYKLFRVRPLWGFLLLISFMPYSFISTADTGPIGLQNVSVFLIYYLLEKWHRSAKDRNSKSFFFPCAIGITLFLGIWSKLAYLYILPALSVLIAYYLIKNKYMAKIYNISALLLLFIIPTLLLLNSIDRTNTNYYQEMFRPTVKGPISVDVPDNHILEIFSYLTNPLLSAHRTFYIRNALTIKGITLLFVVTVFIFLGVIIIKKETGNLGSVVLNLFLFVMTFLFMALVDD